ncbi:MAG: hypothetical protein Fur003_0510 [Candidatus Dojkabacteria bacterium]
MSVIVFAILSRALLIPSTKKQTQMTSKMADLRPRLQELEKKYKHNREALAKEQMKLYKEVGYNPLGCLSSFLPQILILAAIFGVIRTVTSQNFDGLYPFIKDFVFGNAKPALETHFLWWDLSKQYNNLAKEVGYFDLSVLPYLLLAIGVGVVQYLSSRFIQLMQSGSNMNAPKALKNSDQPMSPEEMQAQMSKSMNLMLPLMTAFFTVSAPAVLGIYWFVQSIAYILQYFVIDRNKAVMATKKIFSRSR